MLDLFKGLEKLFKPYKGSLIEVKSLPYHGLSKDEILSVLKKMATLEDKSWIDGKVSGAVYHGGGELLSLYNDVFSIFPVANPLHPDVWPSLVKLENEVVAMVAGLLHGDSNVRGSITMGGTESILLAMKTYRDYYRDKRGITEPEIVLPRSAHAAFLKACEYFNIRPVIVDLDDEFRVDVEKVKESITRNTIAIVGSAPNFPYGTIDPIKDLAEIAMDHGIGMHVDAALGGFVLPFARKLGYDVPQFDFEIEGVTSINVDTHKYGYAPKGSSVILYRNPELFRYQVYTIGDWAGGIYFTPTTLGSKPGFTIAATWAVMLYLGEKGYMEITKAMLEAGRYIINEVGKIKELKVLGKPLWIIAIASDIVNPYVVMDYMSQRGWHLIGLVKPPAFHIALTYRHTLPNVKEAFISDLRESVKDALEKGQPPIGMAPIYGMSAFLPRDQINAILREFIDWLYNPWD
jgi:glutamate/tyrosine decarboxylase-like PLP-dependent enzyme